MQEKIITIYCLCADFLQAYGHKDDPQVQMSTAEVMTVALVTATFLVGNHQASRLFLWEHGYIPTMLSKSRLSRRLHAIPDTLWQALFALLGEIAQQTNATQEYIVDSCPVPVCDNIRIARCHLYQGKEHRGYCASKRRYFFGLRVHLLITATGKPVEVLLAPAAEADIRAFRCLGLDLTAGAEVYLDAAYGDYRFEDTLRQVADITLAAQRKKNSKRPHPGWVNYLCEQKRKRVETTFSQITERFARSIHAVTARGFELKVFLTVLAFAITG